MHTLGQLNRPIMVSWVAAGAEVELAGGQKLSAKMVILGDGAHSKTANKYHKMDLKTMDIAAWRCLSLSHAGASKRVCSSSVGA